MGSIASSENERPPSLGTECATCGHSLNWHMGQGDKTKVLKCDAASGECGCAGFTREPPARLLDCGLCYEENGEEVHPHPECTYVSETDPPDSASSSPDERCSRCAHPRRNHGGGCYLCWDQPSNEGWIHDFAPAEPETECQHRDAYQITGDKLRRPGRRLGYLCEPCGEVWMVTAPKAKPAGCIRPGGCRDIFHGCAHGCDAAADELSQQTQDMEPECDRCGHAPHDGAPCSCGRCAPPPRRPPYAVAYAIEGGAQYEIALPGDASIRAVDGALVITHDSAVLALSTVRPMESA